VFQHSKTEAREEGGDGGKRPLAAFHSQLPLDRKRHGSFLWAPLAERQQYLTAVK
jgi:hypothetical protein